MILGVKCYFEDDATVLGFPNIRAWVIRFVSSKTPTGSMSQKSIESLRCWDETPSDFEITSIIDNFFLKLIYESILTIQTDSSNQPYFHLSEDIFCCVQSSKIPNRDQVARSSFNTPKTKSGKVKKLRFMISATRLKPGTHGGWSQQEIVWGGSHWTGVDWM